MRTAEVEVIHCPLDVMRPCSVAHDDVAVDEHKVVALHTPGTDVPQRLLDEDACSP